MRQRAGHNRTQHKRRTRALSDKRAARAYGTHARRSPARQGNVCALATASVATSPASPAARRAACTAMFARRAAVAAAGSAAADADADAREAAEAACKKRACAIQRCLRVNAYQQAACAPEIEAWEQCVSRVQEALAEKAAAGGGDGGQSAPS